MSRFTERREAIRAAAQEVAPADSFVVLSDNLSHLGNGTFAVSIKTERATPLEDPEPPDSCGEGGDDPLNETLASVLVRPGDDVAHVGRRLLERMDEERVTGLLGYDGPRERVERADRGT